jgi:hypothetical protein
MEEDSEQIKPATLTAREHALLANSMFDNLPTGNEMERAFKDVRSESRIYELRR